MQDWRPAGEPRGVVVNVHGLGDHGGLYPYLVERLVEAGWWVVGPDLRGNGRSPGQRGHVDRWSDFLDDFRALFALLDREAPGLPRFLIGTSLGGLIVLDYAERYPETLDGVVAVSAALGRVGVPAPLLLLARLLSRVWPTFSLETGMDLSGLAHDPGVSRAILDDPLFHRRGTARLGSETLAAIARVQAGAPALRVPVLLLHGADDRMVPPDGTRTFCTQLSAADCTYHEYPGGYHALLADIGRDRPLDDLADWLAARAASRREAGRR